jgi:RimJ/RimL family protein N-acetyltransferase
VLTDVWPLFGLVLRTPRLELRLPSLEQLTALAELAEQGVHDPAVMPFQVPWTDLPPGPRGRAVLQYHWSRWGALTPQDWSLELAVLVDGRPVGTQAVASREFSVTREVHTGSWLGLAHQGRGIGTEMRAAVLLFAFDHLGAVRARSAAFVDNAASLRVSEKLGYRRDGTETLARRGRVTTDVRLLVDPVTFRRPDWRLAADGVAACLPLLGASPG